MSEPVPKGKSPFDRSLVEGPIGPAVWKLAWPTMLQNVIAGLQGVIDHILVGHLIGYAGNAAIGVSWQIFLVVIVFMASLFTGQAVLVARFVGAGDVERVNRTVQQAFLTAIAMYAVLGPLGYFAAPYLLDLVNASPEVDGARAAVPAHQLHVQHRHAAVLHADLGAARRRRRAHAAAAGRDDDGAEPDVLNLTLIPIALGTAGSALGTVIASSTVSSYALYQLFKGRLVIKFSRHMDWRPDWTIIRSLFRFGLPSGVQGIAMNVAGVTLLRFIGALNQSAAAQAAYTIAYTELFSLITWTSVGLMGAAATIAGQNLGAGHPDRAVQGVHAASRIGLAVAAGVGLCFVAFPQALLSRVWRQRSRGRRPLANNCFRPRRVGILHHARADLHRRTAGHRRHAQSVVHHARVADRGADRHVYADRGDAATAAGGHLAGDRAGSLHPLRPHRPPFPPGQMAQHFGCSRRNKN